MKITAEPRSDQWNADDFIGGPRTFTIAGVQVGSAEQKYDVQLVEGEGRAWRPPLTVLRLLIAAWGDDATLWTGRRVTLYRDASIQFGKDAVGGIRVSHMSNLPDGKPFEVKLTSSRGRRASVRVDPLPDAPTPEPIESRTKKAVDWFAGQNVPLASLEAHVGKKVDEWSDAALGQLERDRASIVAEVSA